MKNDEQQFLIQVYQQCGKDDTKRKTPRELIYADGFPMHYNRAGYILEKWADKGWYDYGVNIELGWLTEDGESKAIELIHKMEAQS